MTIFLDVVRLFVIVGCTVLCYSVLQTICQGVVLILATYFFYKCLRKLSEKRIRCTGQGILITGCDTGIGHETALLLDSLGFTVFAGCLSSTGEGAVKLRSALSTRSHLIYLDVTMDECVQKAVDYVRKHCRSEGLWAVINNAAINRLGDVELVTMQMIKEVSDVNYFGVLRITKSFLPLIKATKGRIINVTSVRGRLAVPTDVCYTPTKWAGEAFSDILRREMYRFGVKVIVIEPGNFGGLTGMLNKYNIALNVKTLNESFESATKETQDSYGRQYVNTLIKGLKECGKTTHPTLGPVMRAMEDAVTNTQPQCRYLIQGSNTWLDWYCVLAFLNPFLPEEMMDYILRLIDPLPPVAAQVKL